MLLADIARWPTSPSRDGCLLKFCDAWVFLFGVGLTP